jgi:hypothetical protein
MVLDAIRRTREAASRLLSEQGKATRSPHDHFLADVFGRVRIAEGCCRLAMNQWPAVAEKMIQVFSYHGPPVGSER